MKIAILLPYKENYSKIDTGAVSIFINGVNKLSKFKNDINIYGSTNFKPLSKNYQNLPNRPFRRTPWKIVEKLSPRASNLPLKLSKILPQDNCRGLIPLLGPHLIRILSKSYYGVLRHCRFGIC